MSKRPYDLTVGDVYAANKLKKAKSAATRMAHQMAKSLPVSIPRSRLSLVKGKERVSGFYGRYNLPGGGSENKFFDTALSFNFDNTGEVPATGQLSLIPQGVTESTRVGRKAVVKSIHIRGNAIYIPAASTIGADLCYLYVVLNKQCNGAAAGVTDVLTSNNMNAGMINLANSERFVILKRFVLDFESSAGVSTAYSADTMQVEWYHKCNIPLEFSSTTGAITELKSNNIFLLAGAGVEDDKTSFAGTCRLRFSDD